jgi:hypothetical protein
MRALLLVLLATSVAHAGNNEISVGSHIRALRSDSANALTGDSFAGAAIGYGHALATSGLPVQLWLTGTFIAGGVQGTPFQTMSTDLDMMTFAIGGRARYALRRWLDASARLDLGTARTSVDIRDDAGHSAADSAWGVSAHAALGLETLARYKRLAVGIRLEFGYVFASPISLTATPDAAADGTLRLPMQAAALGSLDLSGPTFGATMTSQF